MNTADLLAIGASLHYPRVVLNLTTKDHLKAGEVAWQAPLRSDDCERIGKLRERLMVWQERMKREKGEW